MVDYVNNSDEKRLREVKALVEHYENGRIEGRTVEGKPLTKEGIQQEISEAESEYRRNETTGHEQLKKEIENWKK